MIKNNIAFALRCVGGVVVIGGVSWSLYALLGWRHLVSALPLFRGQRGVGEHRLGDFERLSTSTPSRLTSSCAWRKSCASWSPKHPQRRSRWSFAPTAAPSCLSEARPAPAAMK